MDAMNAYAADHQRECPLSLDQLSLPAGVEWGPDSTIRCPASHKPYIYIPGQRLSIPDPRDPLWADLNRSSGTTCSRQVLLYEPAGQHPKPNTDGVVVFMDGHVEWLSAEEQAVAISATLRSLATRPE